MVGNIESGRAKILNNSAVRPWGCWIWTAASHDRGYGRMRFNGRVCSSHRVSYEVFHGTPPPDNMMVLHHCDEPRCVNPDHLYLGTQRDNMRDRSDRNRVPRAEPKSVEQAKDWISLHEAQKARAENRISLLKLWIGTPNATIPDATCRVLGGRLR